MRVKARGVIKAKAVRVAGTFAGGLAAESSGAVVLFQRFWFFSIFFSRGFPQPNSNISRNLLQWSKLLCRGTHKD